MPIGISARVPLCSNKETPDRRCRTGGAGQAPGALILQMRCGMYVLRGVAAVRRLGAARTLPILSEHELALLLVLILTCSVELSCCGCV